MTFKQLLKLSRPRFWIYLFGPYLVGLAAAGQAPTPALLLLGLYLTLPANILIYGVNDIFDRATDALNAKKDGYEARLPDQSVNQVWLVIAASNLPFLIALSLLLPASALPWLALFVVTGIGYSAPPIRAKTKPVLDAAFNILYVAPGIAAYVVSSGQQPAWQLIGASLAWCMAMHAYSAVPDIAADKTSCTTTIATFLGARRTISFCSICYIVAVGLSLPFIGWFGFVAGAVYLGLMGMSYRSSQHEAALFGLYKRFPLVNTALGAGLFFVALAA